MKKIKTFTHFNDEVINEFLKQTKGSIVNYNPIVIEYDDKNHFVDPYAGYDAFPVKCTLYFAPLKEMSKDNKMLNKARVNSIMTSNKLDDEVKFMCVNGDLTSTKDSLYIMLELSKPPKGLDFRRYGVEWSGSRLSIQYNHNYYNDVNWGDSINLRKYLEACGVKQLNYN